MIMSVRQTMASVRTNDLIDLINCSERSYIRRSN